MLTCVFSSLKNCSYLIRINDFQMKKQGVNLFFFSNKKTFVSSKICRFVKFSTSTILLSSLMTIYSFMNFGYYLKDSINWNPNWDGDNKLKQENSGNGKAIGGENTRRWHQNILVRHGQYIIPAIKDEEKVLTDIGREQANETGKYLSQQYRNKVNAIYHSNLTRARETAIIISKYFPGVKLVEDSNLAEGVPIAPSPSVSGFKPTTEEIVSDKERIDNAFNTYFSKKGKSFDEKVDIIVCHGNVIRYMFCKGLQYPTSGWLRLNHLNCGVTRMSISTDSLVICSGLGDGGHLSPNIHTYN
ncbi:phosphoglycerate mutase [Cryptosporidium ubiquitum]|uniref:Serine/threonine-protein phosphatase PGAM5, mitochondrial n=1 Tax=Cryptosporidium ubiquitum TaxID=857276 RepID=A0A1J4MNK7_9CRYT|nr:phosphoglycerate mutase [Cryptosporidium ubiquitum]OII74612.1 phosphoglycerate mutase [Cryptosporidium ubiquitum]